MKRLAGVDIAVQWVHPFCARTTRHPIPTFERIDLQRFSSFLQQSTSFPTELALADNFIISLEDVGVDATGDTVKVQRTLSSVSVAGSAIERDAYETAERCTKVQGGVE